MLLRASDEGRSLFSMLLALINRYCNGVIVEGWKTRRSGSRYATRPPWPHRAIIFHVRCRLTSWKTGRASVIPFCRVSTIFKETWKGKERQNVAYRKNN